MAAGKASSFKHSSRAYVKGDNHSGAIGVLRTLDLTFLRLGSAPNRKNGVQATMPDQKCHEEADVCRYD